MSKVRKSLFLSFGQNYISFIIQFLVSLIIARLLTPAEIGIFSVAMVAIGFAHTLRDFGVSSYIIQEKELTPEKVRAAFALTLITAWTMAAVIGLSSSYAAEFYREPGIKSVMLVLSLNFFLIPFGSVPMAYMHREMDFKHISLIKIFPSIIGSLTTLGLAYAGFSYHSMAWGSVVGNVCTILLVQVWRPKNLPLLPGFKEIRKVFSFGMLSNSMMILNDVCQGGPDLIIGRLSGMAMVGYFGRSRGLISMFETLVMKSLWNVALPHFAEQSRTENGVKDGFLRSMTYVSALAWPFYINLGLLAHPIIVVLYGKQWEPSVPLLQLLSIASILTTPFLLLGSMLTAIGQMKQNVYFLTIYSTILTILIFLAAPFGLVAIGSVFIGANLVASLIFIMQCRIVLEVSLWEMVQALRKSAEVAMASAIFPAFILLSDGILPESLWFKLLFGLAGCLLGWIAGIFLLRHPLRNEIGNSFIAFKQFASLSK